jgi:hypothetical protein
MFRLSPACIPVKGFNRSLLYDFDHLTSHFIPNSLYELCIRFPVVEQWKENKSFQEQKIIDEYIDFLKQMSVLIECNIFNAQCFNNIPLEWETSESVSILNIHLNGDLKEQIISALQSFCISYHIKNVVIENYTDIQSLFRCLLVLQNTFVDNVEICLPYHLHINSDFKEWVKHYPFISNIILLSAKEEQMYFLFDGNQISVIETTNTKINSEDKAIQFVLNRSLFIEAHSYNTFYNKRLFLDSIGNIYLNLRSDTLFNIIDNINIEISPDFWHACKDKINICKDCEYRYMCYDSRIPVQINTTLWHYSTDCNYNPYVCKWAGQENYVPLEECGTYTKETGFVPDKDKISKLNKQIWGEDE